ncbi:MAG: C4-dicarboxylate ABC transporter permease [Desulfitibacter sp. BRH_c19]|nr:MAG: C4-dicarboxylate ABC transporter permease [Desulfitibacter sp. BRH_c19]
MKLFRKIPHTYSILFCLIIIAAFLTWIVPAGQYETVEVDGRMVVDPGGFSYVESNPQGPTDILKSIPQGADEIAWIIIFIIFIGASIYVIQSTGAIDAGMKRLVKKLKGREYIVIIVAMLICALGGATYGAAEENIALMLIFVPLALSLGYDSITGAALGLVGMGVGFATALFNPFTVGVAQGIAGIPLFSGALLRFFFFIVQVVIAIVFVVKYANKVKKNPKASPMYEIDQKRKLNLNMNEEFTTRHKLALATLIITFILLPIGMAKLGWWINELVGLFLGMAIIGGLLGGLSLNEVFENFVEGAKQMTYAAVIVAFARGILVILRDGAILDTIIMGLSVPLQSMPSHLTAVGMMFIQTFVNLFIPSGSGQAAVTMPILAPLSDLVGITRQTAVLAYQIGDGFSNIFWPTSGYFIGALGVAGIPWDKWAKWILPLMGLFYIVNVIFMMIAVSIGYGPF